MISPILRKVRRARARAGSYVRAYRLGRMSGVELGRGVQVGKGLYYVNVEPGSRLVIEDGVVLLGKSGFVAQAGGELRIGHHAWVGGFCNIAANGRVAIGAKTMVAQHVTIRDHDHDPDRPPLEGRMLQADVIVGERVWLAARSTISRGVRIGDDAVVAGHAFVTRDVAPKTLVGGIPARVIRVLDR